MFVEVRDNTTYECSKCESRDVQTVSGRNGHYYDTWHVCNKCGHNDRPDRSNESVTYSFNVPDVIKF